MSPAEVALAVRLRLVAELREDLAAVQRRADAVVALTRPAVDEPAEISRLRTLALAFELERYYTSVESMLERAVLNLDGQLPRGERWHAELLRAASVAVPDLRPALVSHLTAERLRDVLGFRHFARHAYDVDPEPARLAALADKVAALTPELVASFAAVFVELERR